MLAGRLKLPDRVATVLALLATSSVGEVGTFPCDPLGWNVLGGDTVRKFNGDDESDGLDLGMTRRESWVQQQETEWRILRDALDIDLS